MQSPRFNQESWTCNILKLWTRCQGFEGKESGREREKEREREREREGEVRGRDDGGQMRKDEYGVGGDGVGGKEVVVKG